MLSNFEVLKFLGNGRFSFVFSVKSKKPQDKNQTYALKRFSLAKVAPIFSARKEYNILKKISLELYPSPFLPTLYYSFSEYYSPIFVITEASPLSLYRLRFMHGALKLSQARFYIVEIMCGLKYLHAKGIVHMELNGHNVMISKTGHILISDFDRSFDSTVDDVHDHSNYDVNSTYAAPEIIDEVIITDRADVWSLGVFTLDMIRITRTPVCIGLDIINVKIGFFPTKSCLLLPQVWQEYFRAVFVPSYQNRPSIQDLEQLALFSDINWRQVEQLKLTPPIAGSRLNALCSLLNTISFSEDPHILQCYNSYFLPKVENSTIQYCTVNGQRSIIQDQPNFLLFAQHHLDWNFISRELASYNFIHPLLNYRRLLMKRSFNESQNREE